MATLPTISKTVDNAFLTTWYQIRKEAADQITQANVLWAALMGKGCFKSQVGGDMITRTLKYGQWITQDVTPTTELTASDEELETMAWWNFRFFGTGVQRNAFDDRKNSGPDKIKDLVQMKLDAAHQALLDKCESSLTNTLDSTEVATTWQGVNDITPAYASRATGTFGHVARSNTWWQPQYLQWTSPNEVYMVDNMRNFFNTIKDKSNEYPNLIATTQTLYELYESFGLDMSQLVKQGSGPLVDLGFDVIKFKGVDMIWTRGETTGNMRFLNTNHIEIIHDPTMWFSMTDWKQEVNTTRRVAHILCAGNVICDSLRSQGLLYA